MQGTIVIYPEPLSTFWFSKIADEMSYIPLWVFSDAAKDFWLLCDIFCKGNNIANVLAFRLLLLLGGHNCAKRGKNIEAENQCIV